MIYRFSALAVSTSILLGCASMELEPPLSNYQGALPEDFKQKLLAFNEQPSTPFRGGVQTYDFDPDASLLTVIFRLPNPRWSWDIGQYEVEQSMFPEACQKLGYEIKNGLGVRYWFAGGGGFVTDVLTDDICRSLSS
ncbi:hypothetical protein C9I98_14155 [Photobacterium sanctipauli]|uniref:Lipoprotein n=1 Tax=Photobacterium sanctipauli TaxID=1342794 RepID=A0A2T3NRV1_9GAMM|nr:hypothetical protein [Photobacterium sanctipauli]PSW18988.1 hypothetical protein C9I98_14155 [Photobacterium sanctipauli]